MEEKTTTYVDPAMTAALIQALPILASCLDEDTKSRIKAALEGLEMGISHVDNPALKKNFENVRFLLGVK
ncbi:hypothetical protein SNN83_002707 [Cronobacter malonaticus]|nr:hypothetical protein [Cronobacter malonaticus]